MDLGPRIQVLTLQVGHCGTFENMNADEYFHPGTSILNSGPSYGDVTLQFTGGVATRVRADSLGVAGQTMSLYVLQ